MKQITQVEESRELLGNLKDISKGSQPEQGTFGPDNAGHHHRCGSRYCYG